MKCPPSSQAVNSSNATPVKQHSQSFKASFISASALLRCKANAWSFSSLSLTIRLFIGMMRDSNSSLSSSAEPVAFSAGKMDPWPEDCQITSGWCSASRDNIAFRRKNSDDNENRHDFEESAIRVGRARV